MAENENNAPPNLNLAKIARGKRSSRRSATPMAGDTMYNAGGADDDALMARTQLISPPPEETLTFRRTSRSMPFTPSLLATNPSTREEAPTSPTPPGHSSASKRKRIAAQPHAIDPNQSSLPTAAEATPNPKPRKQSKHISPSQSQTTPTRPSRPSLFSKSPYELNPNADYIPPLPTSIVSSPSRRSVVSVRARRAMTPIPPYEPPKVVFTPPKEVIMTPTISKSSKRKIVIKSRSKPPSSSKSAATMKELQVIIKKELPDIDFSLPMPPASPTDDPLLLSGPPTSTPTRPPQSARRKGAAQKERRDAAVLTSDPRYNGDDDSQELPVATSAPAVDMNVAERLLPTSSPTDELTELQNMQQPHQFFDWRQHTEPEGSTDWSSMDMDMDLQDASRVPLFDLDLPPTSDIAGWGDTDDDVDNPNHNNGLIDLNNVNENMDSDSDNDTAEAEEGVGEYTGHWRLLTIRTKQDPPSSATRDRMEEWGRPITPFPNKIGRLELVREEGSDDVSEQHGEELKFENALGDQDQNVEEDVEREQEELEVREMSVPVSDEEDHVQEHGAENSGFIEFDTSYNDNEEDDFQSGAQQEFTHESVFTINQDLLSMSAKEGHTTDHEQGSVPVEEDEDFPSASGEPDVDIHDDQNADGPNDSHEEFTSEEIHDQVGSESVHSEDVEEDDEEREVREMSILHDDEGVDEEDEPLSVELLNTSYRQARQVFEPEPALVSTAITEHQEEEQDDGEDDSDIDPDAGVVKITSADPRAAARAAAILKQHDYDCYTKIVMKQRQRARYSYSNVEEGGRGLRQSVMGGGVTKNRGSDTLQKKRRATMGVIGDRVIIPGSPALTLPELLKEAEAEVVSASAGRNSPWRGKGMLWERDPFTTPAPRKSLPEVDPASVGGSWDEDGERVWTKEEWKLLDACFTDERLELGVTTHEALASVDLVNLDNVVQRFIQMMGGDAAVKTFGETWTKDNLLRRARALQKKQREGNIAPPTTPYTPDTNSSIRRLSSISMDIPDFTPLVRHATMPKIQKPVFPVPAVEHALFTNISNEGVEDKEKLPRKKVPPSLLAPRYSHLLEEAIAINSQSTEIADASVANVRVSENTDDPSMLDNEDDITTEEAYQDATNEQDEPPSPPQAPATIGKRVKGFLFSYLPTMSKTAPAQTQRKKVPRQPGLPLPPPDVLGKHRGPITTPARQPAPKPKHPKDLVHLNPAPKLPSKPTLIPRSKKPQRLVELHHISPPPPPVEPKLVAIPRPRRSSGASVKDLVKSFEELDEKQKTEEEGGKRPLQSGLRKVKNAMEGKKGSTTSKSNKPGWRP